MAVIKYKGPDLTVANIPARNDIPLQKRADQMKVAVLDAISDTRVGRGWALYMWSKPRQEWLLLSKEFNDSLNFSEEEKTITGDMVRADFVPLNNLVWDCWIVLADGTVVDCRPTVDGPIIKIGPDTPGEYDGAKLHYMYCYGSLTAQVAAVTYSRAEVDAMIAAVRDDFDRQLAALEASIV